MSRGWIPRRVTVDCSVDFAEPGRSVRDRMVEAAGAVVERGDGRLCRLAWRLIDETRAAIDQVPNTILHKPERELDDEIPF